MSDNKPRVLVRLSHGSRWVLIAGAVVGAAITLLYMLFNPIHRVADAKEPEGALTWIFHPLAEELHRWPEQDILPGMLIGLLVGYGFAVATVFSMQLSRVFYGGWLLVVKAMLGLTTSVLLALLLSHELGLPMLDLALLNTAAYILVVGLWVADAHVSVRYPKIWGQYEEMIRHITGGRVWTITPRCVRPLPPPPGWDEDRCHVGPDDAG